MSSETVLTGVTRSRLLDELLGSTGNDGVKRWAVLLLDPVTTRVFSSAAGIADLLDYGVSLVDDVLKQREPLTTLSGVYFVAPTPEAVARIIEDFGTSRKPLYRDAYLFFSSPLPPELLQRLRGCPGLLARLRTIKEVNLEYLVLNRRTFSTAQDGALRTFFGAGAELAPAYAYEISVAATRLASLFASLKEMPAIRFRAAIPPGDDFPPGLEIRLLVAQRVALELHERLLILQHAGLVPEADTCELVITDRGADPVAPIIHEWTYEAMAHDLLGPDLGSNNVFSYEAETQGGKTERKEHVLDDRDALFSELRFTHFAEATTRISQLLDEFRQKNKAASFKGEGGADLKSMGRLVRALPQYREQLSKLGAHVELATRLTASVDASRLTEFGKLEQDLVYGDATSKEVIALLSQSGSIPPAEKVRLLMCYSATHLEKMDPVREQQWQKVAGLRPADLAVVTNLEYLGVPVYKRSKGMVSLGFGRKRHRAIRKDREGSEDDQQYALSRFVPLLHELVEDAAANRLSTDEYPWVQPPSSPGSSRAPSSAEATPKSMMGGVASARTLRTTGNWARSKPSGNLDRTESGNMSVQSGVGGGPNRRIFVFVVGGTTYSEVRAVHRLSKKLNRDVFLGSTGIETPVQFLDDLASLANPTPQAALEIETPLRQQY
ncbi:SEC1 [Auxenochlorella protothecoides x Auxenochlorella symbiontica]